MENKLPVRRRLKQGIPQCTKSAQTMSDVDSAPSESSLPLSSNSVILTDTLSSNALPLTSIANQLVIDTSASLLAQHSSKSISQPITNPLISESPKFRACQYTNDDVNKPFWNDNCAEYSASLPIIAETTSTPAIRYDTNKQWNESFNSKPRIYPNSLSTGIISAKSLSNLPLKKQADNVCESLRVDVFRMQLSLEMKTVYKRWMNLSRHIYNKAIDAFKNDRDAKVFNVRDDLKRGHFAIEIDECSFPIEAFTQTVCEAKRAVMVGGEVKYRKCDDLTSTICSDGIHNGIIYPVNMTRELKKLIPLDTTLKKIPAKAKQRTVINNMINKSKVKFGTVRRLVKITFDRRRGIFRVQIPVDAKNVEQYQPKRDQVVAIDPGVRTLVTFYSEHWHGYIGEDWQRRTKGLLIRADHYASEAAKCDKFYTKYRLRKRAAIINAKVTNRMKDMQHKIALFLVKNFQIILLPELETKQLVRANKKAQSVSRAIMTSSQYRFKQIMIQKAEKYSSNLILCKEYYTSMTCTKCGSVNEKNASKTFNCSNCKYVVDRDYNGARNIMLKHLSMRVDGPSANRKKLARPKLALKKQVVQ